METKRAQAGTIAALLVLFGSFVVVGAVLSNSSNESTENITVPLIGGFSVLNVSSENLSEENLSEIPPITGEAISEEPIQEAINEEITDESFQERPKALKKELSKIIEEKRHKLNDETASELVTLSLEDDRKFIIKHKSSFDKEKLNKFDTEKEISDFNLIRVDGEIKDIGEILEDDDIEFIELDQDINPLEDSIGYNIEKVKAPDAWNLSKGNGVKVAVLDTGIAAHPDLIISGGYSVVSEDYEDTHGHGTQVAGVLAAILNDEGIVGVAPKASLYAVKIMEGSSGSLSDAIAGVEWAIDNDMDIVSMSFGFDSYSQIFKDVLEQAYEDEGILLIAASGNEGTDNILYPAAYDSVIAVGSTDENDALAASSSYGSDQELVAPGVNIYSTTLNDGYVSASGTSMAAPNVAGVAALIWAHNHSLSNEQIRAKLRNDALDLGSEGKDDYFGYGLVQVNLKTNNFTLINESYFYRIFNISDYGLPNAAFLFWLNGTGMIYDVDFLQGYYLANITYSNGINKSLYLNVSENGSIFLLTATLSQADNFSDHGSSSSDGIGWINEPLTHTIDSSFTSEAECFFISPESSEYNYCFFDTTTHKNNCIAEDGGAFIECGTETVCTVVGSGNMEQPRDILDQSTVGSHSVQGWSYDDCNDRFSREGAGSLTYHVINKKRAACLNSSHWIIEGYYGETTWVNISDVLECAGGSALCLNDLINFTDKSASDSVLDPCINPNTCVGDVQIITEDSSGNPIPSLSVNWTNFASSSNKTTDDFGTANFHFSRPCGEDFLFTVSCPNSSNVCGTYAPEYSSSNYFDSEQLDCSTCTSIIDFELNEEDVIAYKDGNSVTVNITLTNIPVTSNVEVTFKVQGSNGLISNQVSENFTTTSGQRFKYISKTVPMTADDDFLHVYADFTNKVNELNEKNNYVLVPLFEKKLNAYFDVNTGYPKVDNEIKEYLRLFVNESTNQNTADLILCIGKKCSNFQTLNTFTLDTSQKDQEFGYQKNQLTYLGKNVGKSRPYNAILGGFWTESDGKKYVMAYGNDIDGDIAAVKKLVSGKELFFNKDLLYEERTRVIDDFDTTGIAVADLLRNPSNRPYYSNRNSDRFAEIVERILNNNNYEVTIKTVRTVNDNTTLRLKNVNSDYSFNFTETITASSKPVAIGNGVWNSLTTLNKIAQALASDEDSARSVYLIELTGGPETECDSCPNYGYEDLTDYYWPALIAAVHNYSGQSKIDYLGYSNGCRVALDSLKNFSQSGKQNAGYCFDSETGLYNINCNLPSQPVEKFVGLGCPGAFEDSSPEKALFESLGGIVISLFEDSGETHIRYPEVYLEFLKNCYRNASLVECQESFKKLTSDEGKISLNLMKYYKNVMSSDSDPQPGQGLSINSLTLINGKENFEFPLNIIYFFSPNDRLVTLEDQEGIYDGINSSDKNKIIVEGIDHGNIIIFQKAINKIKEALE